MNYQRGKQIISGGEGYIFEVQGHPSRLIKIYKEKDAQGNPIVTSALTEKLEYMKNNPPSSLVSQSVLAWPLETIYEGGKLIGFIMPKLAFDSNMKDICSFKHPISDDTQAVEDFPSVKSRILIAINLVSTVHELHRFGKNGYVIGDFNHENIGINRQTGRICVVDCDSFHIVDDYGKTFRTKYVMPGYLAPEIIDHCYEERAKGRPHLVSEVALETFTKESDLFCLAKHIFKLLMNGTDPFTGVLENTVGSAASPFQGNEAIERNAYVFKSGYYAKAKFCLTANEIPNDLIELFKRAFIDGHTDRHARPSTGEWHNALENYLTSLIPCSSNPKHQHLNTLSSCPFCAADNRWEQAQCAVGTLKKTVQLVSKPASQPYVWQTPPKPPVTPKKSYGWLVATIIIIGLIILGLCIAYENGVFSAETSVDFSQTSAAEVFENSPVSTPPNTSSSAEYYAEAPVLKYYSWHWNEEDTYYINNNVTSIAVFDELVEDVTGFTVGLKLDKGDTGWWSVYVYTGDGSAVGESNFVGNVWVDNIGEWYYSDIEFSKRNVYWVFFLGPIGDDGYCNSWSLYGNIDDFIQS